LNEYRTKNATNMKRDLCIFIYIRDKRAIHVKRDLICRRDVQRTLQI